MLRMSHFLGLVVTNWLELPWALNVSYGDLSRICKGVQIFLTAWGVEFIQWVDLINTGLVIRRIMRFTIDHNSRHLVVISISCVIIGLWIINHFGRFSQKNLAFRFFSFQCIDLLSRHCVNSLKGHCNLQQLLPLARCCKFMLICDFFKLNLSRDVFRWQDLRICWQKDSLFSSWRWFFLLS